MPLSTFRFLLSPSDPTRARAFWPRGRSVAAAAAAPVAVLAGASSAQLEALVIPFLVSFALIGPFAIALRPKVVAFVAGATVVAVGAALFELEAQNLAGDMIGPTLVLILIAPITEELLKLSVAVGDGATYASAAGAGLGFAATENAVYYIAAWGAPTATLAVLVVVRTFTDPLLHVTATTLTTSSWRGTTYGLPAGILLHISWNSLTLVLTALPADVALVVFFVTVVGLGALLWWLRRSPEIRASLSRRPAGPPWARAGA